MTKTIKAVDFSVAGHQQTVDRLLQLMQQRLMVQHDVARWKWNQKSPIEAPRREQELLAKARQQGMAYGLDPDAVNAFFQWQIEVGKLIQTVDFQNWQRKGARSFANVPSLNRTLRPLLDKLDTELLSVLATLAPTLDCPMVQEQEWKRNNKWLFMTCRLGQVVTNYQQGCRYQITDWESEERVCPTTWGNQAASISRAIEDKVCCSTRLCRCSRHRKPRGV